MTNRQHLDRWFEELWGKRNAGIIDEMVHPECRIHGLPGATHGPAGFKPFFELFGAALPTIDVRIEESIEESDRIAVRCSVKAVGHGGKRYEFTGGGIVRMREGRIVEAWNQWGFLSLLAQMGRVDENVFVDEMQQQATLAKM